MSDPDDRPFGHREVSSWRVEQTKVARGEVSALINRVWGGNGAGAIASATLILQSERYDQRYDLWWLWCPGWFCLGLFALSIGHIARVLELRGRIQRLEKAEGILDVPLTDIKRPSYTAGLHLSDPQTLAAVLAAAFFMLGIIFTGRVVYDIMTFTHR